MVQIPKYPFSEMVLCSENKDKYRDGFINAANLLTDRIQIFKEDETIALDLTISGLIYPALYLYRHFIELVLKDYISLEMADKQKKIWHDLSKAYSLAEEVMRKKHPNDFPTDQMQSCKELVDYFHDKDKDGDAFRFSQNSSNEAQFKESFFADLKDIQLKVRDFYSFIKNEM